MRFGPKMSVAALVCVTALGIPATSLAQTYDAASQFSAAANPGPNGIWTYGSYANSSNAQFTPYTYSGTYAAPFAAIDFWAGTSPLYGSVPSISHNPTNNTIGSYGVPPENG